MKRVILAASWLILLCAKLMKWVNLMVHLLDSDNNTVCDFLVDRELSFFDSFFDEEGAFLG